MTMADIQEQSSNQNAELVDIITILTDDHRRIEDLFRQVIDTAEDSERKELFKDLYNEIDTHAVIEEEIFYPALMEENEEKMLEAVSDHATVRFTLAFLRALALAEEFNPSWIAQLKSTQKIFKTHFTEEEERLFPMARTTLGETVIRDMGKEVSNQREGWLFLEEDTGEQ